MTSTNLPSNLITSTLLLSTLAPLAPGERHLVRIDLADAITNETRFPARFSELSINLDAPAGIVCRRVAVEPRPETRERENIVRVLSLEIENASDDPVSIASAKLSLLGYGPAPRKAQPRPAREVLSASTVFSVTRLDGLEALTASSQLISASGGGGSETIVVNDISEVPEEAPDSALIALLNHEPGTLAARWASDGVTKIYTPSLSDALNSDVSSVVNSGSASAPALTATGAARPKLGLQDGFRVWDLNGTSNYFQAPGAAFSPAGESFTAMVLFRLTNNSSGCLAGIRNLGNANNEWILMSQIQGQMDGEIHFPGGGTFVETGTPPKRSEWTLALLVYDKVAAQAHVEMNGVVYPNYAVAGTPVTTGGIFTLGALFNGSAIAIAHKGQIAGFGFVNSTLTPPQRAALWANTRDFLGRSSRAEPLPSQKPALAVKNAGEVVLVSEAQTLYGHPKNLTGYGTEVFPFTHADNTAGVQTQVDAGTGYTALAIARYDVTQPIQYKNPHHLRGLMPAVGNPNAEYPPLHGSRFRALTTSQNLFEIGRLATPDIGDDRPSNLVFSNFAAWGTGEANGVLGVSGNLFLVNHSIDELLIENVCAANWFGGIVIGAGGFSDSAKVSKFHCAAIRHPIYFGLGSNYFNKFTDCVMADGDGPIALLNGNASFVNCSVVRQGRKALSANDSNVYMGATFVESVWAGGDIWSPGLTLFIYDGFVGRAQTRINADGVIIEGHHNTFRDTTFRDIRGAYSNALGSNPDAQGRTGPCAGVRLRSTAHDNLIDCRFQEIADGAVAVVVEAGATDNTIYKYKGMTILDNGTRTKIVDLSL